MEMFARQLTFSVNIHTQYRASRIVRLLYKRERHFSCLQSGEAENCCSQNITRQDTVQQVRTQLGPAISKIRITLAEAREKK